MKRSGARRRKSRSGNGAESGDYRNRLERRAAPLTLRSRDLDACYSVYSVVFLMARWVQRSSYLAWCIKRVCALCHVDFKRPLSVHLPKKAARSSGSKGRGICSMWRLEWTLLPYFVFVIEVYDDTSADYLFTFLEKFFWEMILSTCLIYAWALPEHPDNT